MGLSKLRQSTVSWLCLTVAASFFYAFENSRAADEKSDPRPNSSLSDSLSLALQSGKPTLAYVYYSVACSCTAAHCAIANAAFDSAIGENGLSDSFNVFKVDGFTDESADSLFGVGLVPLVVFFGRDGREVGRIEWDISRKIIDDLMAEGDKPDSE